MSFSEQYSKADIFSGMLFILSYALIAVVIPAICIVLFALIIGYPL